MAWLEENLVQLPFPHNQLKSVVAESIKQSFFCSVFVPGYLAELAHGLETALDQ